MNTLWSNRRQDEGPGRVTRMVRSTTSGSRREGFRPVVGGRLRFLCHKDISCFNRCCADLRLVLTPYDILRLKRRLGLPSDAFLDQYTVLDLGARSIFPMLKLRMREEGERPCPFVSRQGCTVYEDRPGACRLYPLGRGTSWGPPGAGALEFYFIVDESHCMGFGEPREWTVEEWIVDQGVGLYNQMDREWMELVTSRSARLGDLTEDKLKMFFMTSYNLDRFRDFVFQSRFLSAFEIPGEEVRRVYEDDVELMRLGMKWLKFAILGDDTLRRKPIGS